MRWNTTGRRRGSVGLHRSVLIDGVAPHLFTLRSDASESAMDFAALPLDINSGRIYAGAGAGSMKFLLPWSGTGLAIRSVTR